MSTLNEVVFGDTWIELIRSGYGYCKVAEFGPFVGNKQCFRLFAFWRGPNDIHIIRELKVIDDKGKIESQGVERLDTNEEKLNAFIEEYQLKPEEWRAMGDW